MLSRRDLLKYSGQATLGVYVNSLTGFLGSAPSEKKAVRAINVINFIREIEPRFSMDMMLPVREQMALIRKHRLPATWLLQFDALVSGPFVPFLKEHMAEDHEVGFWFEMNERHCKAAGVEWRGRPGYEWDHIPHVAFTIGYTIPERIKLADTAMEEFKRIWGRYPKSVASWNLDSITAGYLSEKYGIDAFAVCRDQIATDGFTIWGAPIAGYYPSKTNLWSPALMPANQIQTPVFRMLGQDPVYYYYNELQDPSGRRFGGPDTMEPVWPSGRHPTFVREFLDMISDAPTLGFAYAQLGQENTFPWDQQAPGYPAQMEALAKLRDTGKVHVETMGETGRRFKKAFKFTPSQAQVQLNDPFGNEHPAEKSIWYQSRYYRANLHFKGDLPYLRDITVYSDETEQPFLRKPTRDTDVEQRLAPVLDGYHWSTHPGARDVVGAGGFFTVGGRRLRLTGEPVAREERDALVVEMPVEGNRKVRVRFDDRKLSVSVTPPFDEKLTISFEWDPAKATVTKGAQSSVRYRWETLDYEVNVSRGTAMKTEKGWDVSQASSGIVLLLSQINSPTERDLVMGW